MFITKIMIFCMFFNSLSIVDNNIKKFYEDNIFNRQYIICKAKINEVVYDDTNEERNIPIESDIRYQHLDISIYTGKYKGTNLQIRHTIEKITPSNYIFKKNDKILIRIFENEDRTKIETVSIEEKVRDFPVVIIILCFVLLLVIIGGINGIKTLFSLIISIFLIIFVYIPFIIKGYNPIFISVIISIISIISMLILIAGINKKTFVAIIGTSFGVIVSCLVAVLFGKLASLTGLEDEYAISFAYIPEYRNYDFVGIMYGTMLIGAIGAIMDVAMSISSSLSEIKEISPKISVKDLIKSGMNIGKDIMGSMANTLILAYVGTTLHLIMLFSVYKITLLEVLNMEQIAVEIIRSMSGSIGLILTIPITVFVSAWYYNKK